MQVCLPKHNYKLDNNLLAVEPRAVDPHCFDADPEPDRDPAQNLDADTDPDPDPDPEGGGGMSAKNVHPPWQNHRYAPESRFCLLFLLDARRIQEARKHTDPMDPDPQHWLHFSVERTTVSMK
jgi:hypothetical protein